MAASDDGVREIQLSGKQLVFLFMAVTVVSVVIFLCGVLVGRGVQARASMKAAPVAALDEDADPTAPAAVPTTPTGPTKVNGLEYQDRLEGTGAPPEKLNTRPTPAPTPTTSAPLPAAAPSATPTAAVPAARSTTAPATPPSSATSAAGPTAKPAAPAPSAPSAPTPSPPAAKDVAVIPAMAEPRGDGFAIQVAALRGRGEAEGVVTRLKGKGYSAFLMPPLPGQPSVYRVRVGKFKTRAEAETVATRLERDEQFQPWITR